MAREWVEARVAVSSDTILTIEAGRSSGRYWLDLWRHRELLLFLAWRDVLVRYKQTAFGVAWALLRPLTTMAVLSVVFGRLAGLPSGGVEYPLFVLAGVLPWQLFAGALAEAANSLIDNASLLSKVYFPRLVIPASAVVVCLVDLAVSTLVLAALMAWYGAFPGARLALAPLFLLHALASALGMGLWLAALNVKYRDFRYLVPFLVQFGLFISPVGFSTGIVPQRWRLFFALNPMAGAIDGFRWATGAAAGLDAEAWLVSAAVAGAALAGGLRYFRSAEQRFADVI